MYSVLSKLSEMYTFAYQKTLFHRLFLLAFKIAESRQCILNLIKYAIS